MHALPAVMVALLLLAGVARSQEPRLTDEQVARVRMLALDNISRALCGAAPCAPASATEQASPPLTLDETRRVMARGMISEAGEQCGLDWRMSNFLPMMTYWRHIMKKDERQLALIGLVHGIAQGFARSDTAMVCTPQMRESIARQLTFEP